MYGVAALLGIAGRLDWVDSPAWLQQSWVIAVAVALFAVEFVVDKIAAVDSAWDAVHTVPPSRWPAPCSSAAPTLDAATVALAAAGGAARRSVPHAPRRRCAVLVNTSPEPVSNVVVSPGRGRARRRADGRWRSPTPSSPSSITLVLFVASIVVTVVLFRIRARRVAPDRQPRGANGPQRQGVGRTGIRPRGEATSPKRPVGSIHSVLAWSISAARGRRSSTT